MRRQCAVPVEAAHTPPLIYWPAARAPPCRSSCVDACEIFRGPASRSKLTPLWHGWAEASVVPAAGEVPMGPNWWIALVSSAGAGSLVCWCSAGAASGRWSLEAGFELLAARKMLCEAGWMMPSALAAKLRSKRVSAPLWRSCVAPAHHPSDFPGPFIAPCSDRSGLSVGPFKPH